MKLIIIVKTKNRPKTFSKTTLQYISRAGFDYRIYVKRKEYQKYISAIEDAEDTYYLNVPKDNIKRGPLRIPKKYNLVLYLPDNIKGFTDDKLLWFCREVGVLRNRFNKDKSFNAYTTKNLIAGIAAKMVKLKYD